MFYSPVNLIDVLVVLKCMAQAQYLREAAILSARTDWTLASVKEQYAREFAQHGFIIMVNLYGDSYVGVPYDGLIFVSTPHGARIVTTDEMLTPEQEYLYAKEISTC